VATLIPGPYHAGKGRERLARRLEVQFQDAVQILYFGQRAIDAYGSLVHDDHPVGDQFNLIEKVRGEEDAPALGRHTAKNGREEVMTDHWVQARRRLV
jgi:hypothetical protein